MASLNNCLAYNHTDLVDSWKNLNEQIYTALGNVCVLEHGQPGPYAIQHDLFVVQQRCLANMQPQLAFDKDLCLFDTHELQRMNHKAVKRINLYNKTLNFLRPRSEQLDPRIAMINERFLKYIKMLESPILDQSTFKKINSKFDSLQNMLVSVNQNCPLNNLTYETTQKAIDSAEALVKSLEDGLKIVGNLPEVSFEECMRPIHILQELKEELNSNDQKKGFYVLCTKLQNIKSRPLFQGLNSASVADRLAYYFNHSLPGDFQSQKSAILRTQIEFLLGLLSHEIRNEHAMNETHQEEAKEHFTQIFNYLENLELDEKDLPEGHTNIAHFLHGTLYATQLNEHQQNRTLDDPDDPKFLGDFGQRAFCGDDYIPAWIRQIALHEVMSALEETWGIINPRP